MTPPLVRPTTRKRAAILAAAEQLFLTHGYLGTSMDELAELSQVSKQTIYTNFGSKELLFVELVSSMTVNAGDGIDDLDVETVVDGEVASYLENYAVNQLSIVLTPRLLKLRRLVIGEVGRFPALAQALYEGGPQRAIRSLSRALESLARRELLSLDDAVEAATTFNWLIMGAPVNEAMLLGDAAIPSAEALRAHAGNSTRVFLAAYGPVARATT